MIRRIALLGLCTFAPLHQSRADSPGVDILAMQALSPADCSRILRVSNNVSEDKIKIAWGTFGKGTACIRRWAARNPGKPHSLWIDFTNGTCRRSGRHCEPGREIGASLNQAALNKALSHGGTLEKEMKTRARQINRLLSELSLIPGLDLTTTIGESLEDDNSTAAHIGLNGFLRRNFTNVLFARNPNVPKLSMASLAGDDVFELHNVGGLNRRPCVFSNDGTDIDLSRARRPLKAHFSVSGVYRQFKRAAKSGCSVRIWHNDQGIVDSKVIRPSKRNYRVYHQDVSVVNQLLRRIEYVRN